MLSEDCQIELRFILREALSRAKEAVTEEDETGAGEWLDIAKDADHILRKNGV